MRPDGTKLTSDTNTNLAVIYEVGNLIYIHGKCQN